MSSLNAVSMTQFGGAAKQVPSLKELQKRKVDILVRRKEMGQKEIELSQRKFKIAKQAEKEARQVPSLKELQKRKVDILVRRKEMTQKEIELSQRKFKIAKQAEKEARTTHLSKFTEIFNSMTGEKSEIKNGMIKAERERKHLASQVNEFPTLFNQDPKKELKNKYDDYYNEEIDAAIKELEDIKKALEAELEVHGLEM